MIFTYTLLALSICAVWLPSLQFGNGLNLFPWLALFCSAIVSAYAAGIIHAAALPSLVLLLLFAFLAARNRATRAQRFVFGTGTALLALALAMHRLPGFDNPVLLADIKLSADAAPFTLYANFDKGAAGLVLIALLCRRAKSVADFSYAMHSALPVILATTVVVLITAVGIGFVRVEFKLSSHILMFFAVNLFFSVIAEEAFFRGFLQERLANVFSSARLGNAFAVAASALLFGAAHFAGGTKFAVLAALAGLGNALAYARSRRIESAIATHFVLNAAHFLGFTYPYLQ